MCGIGGVRRFGEEPILKYHIDMLLGGLERRGTDASGVAIQQADGTVVVHKDDETASKYLVSDGYKEFIAAQLRDDTKTVLVHTRSATGTASPIQNQNNHPLFAGNTAVTHNGVLYNHDELFTKHRWERKAETDTDVLRALLDAEGFTKKGIRMLSQVEGSAAFAAVAQAYPGYLLLAKSGNPLELASTANHMFWASEKSALHKAIRPWVRRFGLPFQKSNIEVSFLTMPSDTVYLFNENELVWHDAFRVLAYTKSRHGAFFNDCEMRWERDMLVGACDADDDGKTVVMDKAVTLVLCPACKVACRVKAHQMLKPIAKLRCGKCGKGIGEALLAKKGEKTGA